MHFCGFAVARDSEVFQDCGSRVEQQNRVDVLGGTLSETHRKRDEFLVPGIFLPSVQQSLKNKLFDAVIFDKSSRDEFLSVFEVFFVCHHFFMKRNECDSTWKTVS